MTMSIVSFLTYFVELVGSYICLLEDLSNFLKRDHFFFFPLVFFISTSCKGLCCRKDKPLSCELPYILLNLTKHLIIGCLSISRCLAYWIPLHSLLFSQFLSDLLWLLIAAFYCYASMQFSPIFYLLNNDHIL